MVTFYEINSDGTPGKPVLFLDTLKVSTIEQTAQTAEARGGKGNPQLISWDYGKDITLTMEDALFSPKSLSIMMANGSVNTATETITKTAVLPLGAADDSNIVKAARDYIIADIYDENEGSKRVKLYCGTSSTIPEGEVALGTNITISDTLYSENGATIDSAFTKATLQSIVSTGSTSLSDYAGQNVMFKYTVRASTKTLEVSADKFPGTYYIVGDTYSRSDTTGKDQFFQFIVPKAKLKAEQTITLQAEGDPSTFNMNLTVLRPDDGVMMKLKQYDLVENV